MGHLITSHLHWMTRIDTNHQRWVWGAGAIKETIWDDRRLFFMSKLFSWHSHPRVTTNLLLIQGVMTVATWFCINAQNLYSRSSWNDASNKSGYANDSRPRSLLTITKRDQGYWPIWISENWLSLKSIMDSWIISLSVYWVTFIDLMSVILTG